MSYEALRAHILYDHEFLASLKCRLKVALDFLEEALCNHETREMWCLQNDIGEELIDFLDGNGFEIKRDARIGGFAPYGWIMNNYASIIIVWRPGEYYSRKPITPRERKEVNITWQPCDWKREYNAVWHLILDKNKPPWRKI